MHFGQKCSYLDFSWTPSMTICYIATPKSRWPHLTNHCENERIFETFYIANIKISQTLPYIFFKQRKMDRSRHCFFSEKHFPLNITTLHFYITTNHLTSNLHIPLEFWVLSNFEIPSSSILHWNSPKGTVYFAKCSCVNYPFAPKKNIYIPLLPSLLSILNSDFNIK